MTRPSSPMRRCAAAIGVAVAMTSIATACTGGTTSGHASSSATSILPTTTTEGPHAPRVRVVGDGGGTSTGSAIAAALATTDLLDLSHPDASVASLLDLPADPASPDEGRLHATLEQAVSPAPDVIVVSVGAEVFDSRAPMAICSDTMWSTMGLAQFDACAVPELDRLHFDQRTMAIVLDLLAHTRDAKVVLLYVDPTITAKGLQSWQRDEVVALVNHRIDMAAANTAEGGANWGERLLVTDAASAIDAARARGWIP